MPGPRMNFRAQNRKMTAIVNLFGSVRRNPGDSWMLARVYLLLVLMRGVITVLPLRKITRHLGDGASETPLEGISPEQMRYARRIAWSIRRIAKLTPTNSNCYPQALTARWFLHRKGIPSTIYYGAAFNTSGDGLDTHVWIRCSNYLVSGAPVHQRYGVVSKFADFA